MHVLFAVALLALTMPSSLIEAIPPDKAIIQLSPKFGTVTFDHLKHAKRDDMVCATCHHPVQGRQATNFLCRDCHPRRLDCRRRSQTQTDCRGEAGTASALDAKTAFHRLCRGCHDSIMSRFLQDRILPGPSDRCRDCHD